MIDKNFRNMKKGRLYVTVLTLLCFIVLGCEKKESKKMYSNRTLSERYDQVKEAFNVMNKRVIMPADGYLKYPYLVPAGFYSQMWDWDGFFMGTYFCSIGKPECLKYWALNLIQGIDEKGYVSGCATTKGPRPIMGDFSMKPFLAQGVLFSSRAMGDFEWVRSYYDKLKLTLEYRNITQKDSLTGLYYWQNAMQSGADNNVALNYFMDDKRTFLACDASTMQMREYQAMAMIAKELSQEEDHLKYMDEAKKLKSAINKYLWCEEDKIYYNVDRETGDFYKRISYSSFWPLMNNVAPMDKGRSMIDKYLLSDLHMKSKFGLRSLSKQDPDYNNKNIIVPFSNWQGPIWPIANYIYAIGLKYYGYEEDVKWVAMTVTDLLMKDYKMYKTMHENYCAETGQPLAPSDDYKDKDGNIIGFVSWNLCFEPLLKSIISGEWELLEICEID